MRNLLISLAVFSFFSFLGDALFAQTPPPAPTNSEKYAPYELDNEVRMLFSAGQMDKLEKAMKKSPSFMSVKKLLTPLFDGQKLRKTVKIDATHSVEWVDNGIEKPSQIFLVDLTQSVAKQELYSNFQEGMDIASIIIDFSVSPNGQFLTVTSSEYGSIDQVDSVVIDIPARNIVETLHLAYNLSAWNSPTTVLYYRLNEDGSSSFAQYDPVKMEDVTVDTDIVGTDAELVLLQNENTGKFSLQNSRDGSVLDLDLTQTGAISVVGHDQDFAYLLSYNSPKNSASILKFDRKSAQGTVVSAQTLITESSQFLEKTWMINNAILAQVRAGADRWLRVYSMDGQTVQTVAVPNCCSITSVSWATPGKTLKVGFTSPLLATGSADLDVSTGQWDHDPDVSMLTVGNLSLMSEVVFSTSKDGTKIPIRLVHLKGLTQDSSHPVVIQAYGGFGLSGYLDPRFDPASLEFLKRGGIYAGPGVRGGNEYGPTWHTQAMLTNKNKTYEDLVSAAQQLVADKWTTPNLVITRGTSNGGLTVAATALLYPDSFGLVIPISGVDDLLAKDYLDSVNEGWSYEYGSVDKYRDFLTTISPVENASHQGNVKFLILDGAEDTRVNPAHSVKLARALEDLGPHPENVHLLTMQNAGHWLESVSYQNSIGLKTEIVIWTEIFDLAGWKPTTPLHLN